MEVKKIIILIVALCFNAVLVCAQQYNITAYIKSKNTGEAVIFAYCYNTVAKTFTTSNEDGFVHLKTKAAKVDLIFSHTGYIADTVSIDVNKDSCIHVFLREYLLEEVRIFSKENNFVQQSTDGKITISPTLINKHPSTLGEADLIKTISVLPGVSSGNKLYSNLYVRGGGKQNNLILIDDAPTYNSNHVFGLLSVFNADAVKQVDFYKSDFPAPYGGVTSSIVDIYTKDGNFTSYKGKFKLSTLYSKLFVEGPIINDKLSFFLSGRYSYLDLFTLPLKRLYNTTASLSYPSYGFYDLNTKLTYKISLKKKLSIGFFKSNDRLSVSDKDSYGKPYEEKIRNYYRNSSFSLQYKSDIFGAAYLRTSVVYSKYNNIYDSFWETQFTEDKQSKEEYYSSRVENLRFKAQIDFKPLKNNAVKVGWKPAMLFVQPGYTSYKETTPEESTTSYAGNKQVKLAFENVLYIESDFTISKNLILNSGIRGVLFNKDAAILRFEPRFSLRYSTGSYLSLKAGYSRMNQFLHCITTNTQQTGSEFWLLSDKTFVPEQSDQYNTGISLLMPFGVEFSSDIYYKVGKNALYYSFIESDPEYLANYSELTYRNGIRQSYGVEVMMRKQSEKFQTLVSYSFARSFIRFEKLNNNIRFPTQQDKLHDLTFVFLWNINKINSLNVNFSYNSGAPITLPVAYAKETAFSEAHYIFSGINNKRLPAYHRLDISWVRTKYKKKNRKRDFYLNLYNAYAKQNAVYVYFRDNKSFKTAINLIIPTIGYVWYF